MRISIVIPAYNEASRLPSFVLAARDYLSATFGDDYEVLVVDDGSRDGTGALARRLAESWPQLTVLGHETNRGKGAAVRTGVLASRGPLVLFADADGATPIAEERTLREAIAAGADLAVGSRLLGGAGRDRRRHRDLLGKAFAWLARAMLRPGVRDPQCGFKMFRGAVGRRLFEICPEDGYLFDLQVLVAARRLGHRVAEVPVRWAEVPGSKVRLVRDSLAMLAGLVRLFVAPRPSSRPDPGPVAVAGDPVCDRPMARR